MVRSNPCPVFWGIPVSRVFIDTPGETGKKIPESSRIRKNGKAINFGKDDG